jgi:peptidoglycan/LPS O-acetylase OafA/YrhL
LRTHPSGSEAASGGQRAQALDGLRALAALGVMLFHFWVYTQPVAPGAPLTTVEQHVWQSTRWGLLLFFVLSGFLLYRPWVRVALGSGKRPELGRYLRSRAARIAPAYYLALSGAFLIGVLGSSPPMRMPTDGTAPLFLVFGQNFSDHSLNTLDTPMWTLPIEISFYLVLPLIGIVALRVCRSRLHQAFVTAGLVAIGVAWAHLASALWFYDVVLPQMLPFFAFGMLVAVLIEGRTLSARLCRFLVVAAAFTYLVNLALHTWAPSVATGLEDMPVALGFAALVAVGAVGEWVPWLFRLRFVVWLGVVSYGTYLWHQPVMCLLGGHGLLPRNVWLELALVVPPTLLIAWISWRFVEKPALGWGRRRGEERRPGRGRRTDPAPGGDLAKPAAAMAGAKQP